MYDKPAGSELSNYLNTKRSSQKQSSTLPSGYREEHKRVVYISHPTKPGKRTKYRLCYTKSDEYDPGNKDVLKVEISYDLEKLVHYIKKILDFRRFERLKVYVKYSEFLRLHDGLERINNDLFTCNYKFKFSFVPNNYKDDDYVLLYEIDCIGKGGHLG